VKVSDSKSDIRQNLPALSREKLQSATLFAKECLLNWNTFVNSRRIGFYLAMEDEVSLQFLFDSGKDLYLPRFNSDSKCYEMALVKNEASLQDGRFGIREPKMTCLAAVENEIDLWFVPAVAFDKTGNRLGRGGGFYDRLLENESGLKVGVALSERILIDVPAENWDVKMNFVLTDKEIMNCNGN
jgi:5-formyltetrahydrofolate cyclo-ligase